MYCPQCGAQNSSESKFCQHCGTSLLNETETQAVAASEALQIPLQAFHQETTANDDIRTFVGPRADRYFQKWSKPSTVGWNWPAFFLGPVWFAYRKMYLSSLIIFAIVLVISTVVPTGDRGLSYVLGVVYALFANNLYKSHVDRKVAKLKAVYPNPTALSGMLAKKGGTSVLGSIGMTILGFVILGIGIVISNPSTFSPSASDLSSNSSNSGSTTDNSTDTSTTSASTSTSSSSSSSDSNQVGFVKALTNVDSSITISDSTVSYVSQNAQYFPYKGAFADVEAKVDHSVTMPLLLKNVDPYLTSLFETSGQVIKVDETNNTSFGDITEVEIADDNGDVEDVAYNGTTDASIVEGANVTFIGLPVAKYSYQNVSGGYTNTVLFDGVAVQVTQGN